MARLTIQEAAKLTNVSARTIRRRVKDGSLHAEKVLRDGREVWMIDPGSLAAWAEADGHPMTAGGREGAPVQGVDHDRPADGDGQDCSTGAAQVDTKGQLEVDRLQVDIDRLQQQVKGLEQERDWLRGHVDTLTRALPPARDEQTKEEKLSWWQRVLRR